MSDNYHHLSLCPRDPLISRDGRPFGAGMRMRTLPWFYPSVLAGSLRTLLGNQKGGFASASSDTSAKEYQLLVEELKKIAVAGPFPALDDSLYFPAPADVAVRKNRDETLEVFAARPVDLAQQYPHGAGCDLPDGLDPALLPDSIGDDFKVEPPPAFWSEAQVDRWLANAAGSGFLPPGITSWPDGFLKMPPQDERTHVRMDYAAGAGKSGDLFQTTGLDIAFMAAGESGYESPVRLAVRVTNSGGFSEYLRQLNEWHPFGGERRLVHWRAGQTASWKCPEQVSMQLGRNPSFIRLVLASPAVFSNGWRPDWLGALRLDSGKAVLVGMIPETSLRVRLVSACVDRWRPISGWEYQQGKGRPKPIRRLVPAGAVYFLRVLSGDPAELIGRWLASVCDDEQDQRDGFGLALWGVWMPEKPSHTFDIPQGESIHA